MATKGVERPAFPFMLYLLLAILLAMTPIVCLISLVDCLGVTQELQANAGEFRDQTESGTILSFNLVDTGLKLFQDIQNPVEHRPMVGSGSPDMRFLGREMRLNDCPEFVIDFPECHTSRVLFET